MGRKRSDKEDARNQPTPRKSKPVSVSVTPTTCPHCFCRVMKSDITGDIQPHYKGDGQTLCE